MLTPLNRMDLSVTRGIGDRHECASPRSSPAGSKVAFRIIQVLAVKIDSIDQLKM